MKNKKHELKRNLTLVKDLLTNGQIQTIFGRSKVLRPKIEKMITKAKEYHQKEANQLHIRRVLLSKLSNNNQLVDQFLECGKKYIDRNGGYLRNTKLPIKNGTEFSVLSLI